MIFIFEKLGSAKFLAIGTFLLAHLLFVLLGLTYYEEGADTFIKNTLEGIFLNHNTLPPFSFAGHFVLSSLYLLFYKQFPSLPWYDFFTVFYSTLAATLVFLSFKKVLPKVNTSIVFFLSFLFFIDNILMLEFTRISMFIAICSTFLLLLKKEKELNFDIFVLQILLSLSVFLRIESFLLSVLLMTSFVLVNKDFSRNIKFLIPSFTLSIVLSILLNINWTERDRKYNELRPFQFSLLDLEIKQKIPFENSKDSITMEASKSFFLNDPENINVVFFQKYLLPQDKNPFHFFNFITQTDFSFSALKIKFSRTQGRYYLFLFLGLFFALLSESNDKRKKSLFIFLFSISLLFGVLILFKMENRVLFPSSFGILLLITHNNAIKSKLIFFYLTILVFIATPDLKYEELCKRYTEIEKTHDIIDALPNDKIIFYDLNLTVWEGRKPFEQWNTEKKIVSIDNALLFMTDEYKETMISLFHTSETNRIIQNSINEKNYVFFGEIKRALLIKMYMEKVYMKPLNLEILERFSNKISAYRYI